jgi:hypothetical protein
MLLLVCSTMAHTTRYAALVPLALCLLSVGCKVEIPWVDPLDATVSVVESQEADEWAFFDFDAGVQLVGDDGLPLLLEDPGSVGDWDLALSQFVLATASGPYGGGDSLSQGVLELVQGNEEEPPSIGDEEAQVSCSSLSEDVWEADTDADPDLAGPRPSVGHNIKLTTWFRYRLSSHQAIPNFAVFAVQDRFGRCVRLQVADYYDDSGESGFVTMYWQYLVD